MVTLFKREPAIREAGAYDAKRRFGALLDCIARGEEIMITKRGKAVAKRVAPGGGDDPAIARAAFDLVPQQKVAPELPRGPSPEGANMLILDAALPHRTNCAKRAATAFLAIRVSR